MASLWIRYTLLPNQLKAAEEAGSHYINSTLAMWNPIDREA